YEEVFDFGPDQPSFVEWRAGPEAEDINEDGEIDGADYDLFFGFGPDQPSFVEWRASGEAFDVDGDGEITLLDYEEFFDFGPDQPSFVEWRAGPEAEDLDGDGVVDEIDFETFRWLASDEAEDLDADGLIAYADFEIYLFGGEGGEFGETPILIDFDPEDGDQERRLGRNARVGRRYTLQFNITEAQQIKGWSVTITFDPTQLGYVDGSFSVTDFIPGGFPLVRPVEGQIGVGTTILLGDVSNSGTATLGSIELEVLAGFSGAAEVEIVRYGLRPVDGDQLFQEVSSVVVITDESTGDAPPGDFDGDGIVDFPDFFLFAEAFWSDDATYDLSGDGFVDFADLFIFADFFGERLPLFKLLALAQEYLGLPVTATLEQNYPNPFNSSTTIPFALPTDGEVRLEIYDILGQRIRTLAAQDMPAGLHHIYWDGYDDGGRQVAAGVFFYRLEVSFETGVPAFTEVRKLTLAE
ncbi:MAG: FlgD immunoglobulin-like domain containing protein, partial [Candidatus Latescibacterota bacterium]